MYFKKTSKMLKISCKTIDKGGPGGGGGVLTLEITEHFSVLTLAILADLLSGVLELATASCSRTEAA